MPAKIVKPLCFLFRQPRRASSCSKPGPRIMPTLPENLSDYVRRTLGHKGVEVMTSTRVTACDTHGVELEHGRLDAGTVIWAAGVVASPAARWINAEHDRAGRVLVNPDLSVP